MSVSSLRDTVEQVDEHAILLGRHRSLVAVVTPATDHEPHGNLLGALLLNAGVVHRIGPNRMSVRIARVLAAAGVTSVRFDLSGLGDSPPRRDRLSFADAAVEDTQDVMSQLEQTYGVRRFVLIGLCSGGAVSFKTALADERVVGMVLINPNGLDHDEEWTAQVKQRAQGRRYRRLALHSRTSWLKALSGEINYRVLAAFLRSLVGQVVRRNEKVGAIASRLSADFGRLLGRGTNILMCCSEGDPSLGGAGTDLRGRRAGHPLGAVRGHDLAAWRPCSDSRVESALVPRPDSSVGCHGEEGSNSRDMTGSCTPLYFGPPERRLFGLLHLPDRPAPRAVGVVLCGSFGHEAVRSHRAFKTLADSLRHAGFPVLCFDYYGAGDSGGEGADVSVAGCLHDIAQAIEELKTRGAAPRVVLVGLRLKRFS